MPPELTEAEMRYLASHYPGVLSQYAWLLECYAMQWDEAAALKHIPLRGHNERGMAEARLRARRAMLDGWHRHCHESAQGVA